jgi:hypothetical protein
MIILADDAVAAGISAHRSTGNDPAKAAVVRWSSAVKLQSCSFLIRHRFSSLKIKTSTSYSSRSSVFRSLPSRILDSIR